MNAVQVLLDSGAKTELCTNSGETALMKVSLIIRVLTHSAHTQKSLGFILQTN